MLSWCGPDEGPRLARPWPGAEKRILRKLLSAIAFVVFFGGVSFPAVAEVTETPIDVKRLRDLLDDGFAALANNNPGRARRLFQKANGLAGGHSVEAFFGIARADLALGEFDRVVRVAQQLLDQPGIGEMRAPVLQLLGVALLAKEVQRYPFEAINDFPGPPRDLKHASESLAPAEAALRSAIEVSGGALNSARYYLAELLTRQRKDHEALSVLKEYLGRGIDPGAEESVRALSAWLECVAATSPIEPDPAVVVQPQLVRRIEPHFPEHARQARLEGQVAISAVIDVEGSVQCVFPWNQAPMGFTEASTRAIREWRYSPAFKDGHPVAVYFLVFVQFKMRPSR